MPSTDKPAQNGFGKHIVLVGAMGVGKTTVGRELANRLERPFLDTDSELEEAHGVTGSEIAERDSVERLHAIELDTFVEMAQTETPSVLSPAASVIDADLGRRILSRHLTVWLDAPEDVLADRRDSDGHRREVDEDEVIELERRRRPHWRRLSAIRIDTSKPVADVVQELMAEVRRLGSG